MGSYKFEGEYKQIHDNIKLSSKNMNQKDSMLWEDKFSKYVQPASQKKLVPLWYIKQIKAKMSKDKFKIEMLNKSWPRQVVMYLKKWKRDISQWYIQKLVAIGVLYNQWLKIQMLDKNQRKYIKKLKITHEEINPLLLGLVTSKKRNFKFDDMQKINKKIVDNNYEKNSYINKQAFFSKSSDYKNKVADYKINREDKDGFTLLPE